MLTSYVRGQGTVIPTMLFGLGGVGSRTVDRIARRASSLPDWDSHLRGLTTFVALDTNILDLDALKHVPNESRIHIGGVDKRNIVENYRRSLNRQALQWIDRNYIPRPGIKPGAGQIRVESRLGYHAASSSIRAKLERLVGYTLEGNNTWRKNNPPIYYVYLYCSVAGGTGSGSFLALAYLIDDILKAQGWQPRIIGNLVLSTLLTDKVAADLHPNIHANTYAALKELEHLSKLGYATVQRERPDGEEFVFWNNENSDKLPKVTDKPMFHAFLIDRPVEADIDNVEDTLADSSFLQLFTPVIDSVAGEYDNYEQHLQALTHFAGENRAVGQGYTKNFGAFGVAALTVPADDLLEYSALRFAAEALRRQITFGAGANSSDERERALERLKINYDDPAFRNLDESARYEAINDSFVECVRAMAEMDVRDKIPSGYWARLVEDADLGQLQGHKDNGSEIRTDSLRKKILDGLENERKPILAKVSIKSRPFVFTREGYNQYSEMLTKFKEDIRRSQVDIESGKVRLRAAAAEGLALTRLDPKPTPMQERYLIVQLLRELDKTLIPQAKSAIEKTRAGAFEGGMRERLENELKASLQDAAQAKIWMGMSWDEEGFQQTRNNAQAEMEKVGHAQVKFFETDLVLAQILSFREYLAARARQYARLATRMNDLVEELESEAASLLNGVAPRVPRLQNSVEVFETIQQPRRRLWAEVFRQLFLDGGLDLTTFDRQVLATAVAAQLSPVKDKVSGRFVEKDLPVLVADLKRAMVDLGRTRLRPAIFGDQDQRGLTLEVALQLEARLMLPRAPGVPLRDEEIMGYVVEKFKAVEHAALLLARTKCDQMRSLDDGVKLANKRHFLLSDQFSPEFQSRFVQVLATSKRQLARIVIPDSRIAIVHDVELPIPMYYFEAVNGEIHEAYKKVMADQNRAFHVHTAHYWEHALPDLNPFQAEIGVTWSLGMLLDGMITGVIDYEAGVWRWHRTGAVEQLGPNLALALYGLVSLHSDKDLGPRLHRGIEEARTPLGGEEVKARLQQTRKTLDETIEEIAALTRTNQRTAEHEMELPILRALLHLVEQRLQSGQQGNAGKSSAARASLGDSLKFK